MVTKPVRISEPLYQMLIREAREEGKRLPEVLATMVQRAKGADELRAQIRPLELKAVKLKRENEILREQLTQSHEHLREAIEELRKIPNEEMGNMLYEFFESDKGQELLKQLRSLTSK